MLKMLLFDELIKINAGAMPKDIMSDKESRLLPKSAMLFFFLAKKPSKLSKNIAIKINLDERIRSPIKIKYIAKSPSVALASVKKFGKEINAVISVSFMISINQISL